MVKSTIGHSRRSVGRCRPEYPGRRLWGWTIELVTSEPTDVAVASAAGLFQRAVTAGAAIGWVDPPSVAEVGALLRGIAADVPAGDAALVLARSGQDVLGIGYWRRYERPTHRVNADLSKVAVDALSRDGVSGGR